MGGFATLDDIEVAGKRVLVRADLNVPMRDGQVTDATRIERLVPTLQHLRDQGARIIVMSHFGRPKGKVDAALSLRPLSEALSTALDGLVIQFADDCVGVAASEKSDKLQDGDVLLLENLRFHPGEESNDAEFAAALAALGDIYIDDAFSCAHRAHASVAALAELLPAGAGRGMQAELDALEKALGSPDRPVAAIVGGAKVSTKLDLLQNMISKVDFLVIGGAMANTFLQAQGLDVGKSLHEPELAETARDVVAAAERASCEIALPTDVVIAATLSEGAPCDVVEVGSVPADMMILDIGPISAAHLGKRLAECRTLVWNGPLGAFEIPPFDAATNAVAADAARLTKAGELLSVAGGGDTVAALAHAGVAEDFTYMSTAGGAFLEWLEGKPLPGVAALIK
ncbi:MAG: phosphoglycerate kinase [Alphaproteobacteria bacterium]|nr:phosphoglycerate kinase [Alphaproteobacteria bacterium]